MLLRILIARVQPVVVITHDAEVAARARRQIRIVDGELQAGTVRPQIIDKRPFEQTSHATSLRRNLHFGQLMRAALSSSLGATRSNRILLFAFALGAAGIVTSVGISETAANQVVNRLSQAALDQVVVELPSTWSGGSRRTRQRVALGSSSVSSVSGSKRPWVRAMPLFRTASRRHECRFSRPDPWSESESCKHRRSDCGSVEWRQDCLAPLFHLRWLG